MLTVDEAGKIILDALQPLPPEMIAFADTLGRVLADDLIADAPVPLFAQSAMDGFALRSTDTYYVLESGRITGSGEGGAGALDDVRAALAV